MSPQPCFQHVSAPRRQRRGRVSTNHPRDSSGLSKWGNKCALVGVETLTFALRALFQLLSGTVKFTVLDTIIHFSNKHFNQSYPQILVQLAN